MVIHKQKPVAFAAKATNADPELISIGFRDY
jgi:hypothetical protein